MTKKRAIISYDKLTIEQKKQLLVSYPNGFSSGMQQIKTPTGETLDALFWETDEIIYLVKINKPAFKTKSLDDDEDDEDDEDLDDDKIPKINPSKEDDFDDEEEDDYDDKSDGKEEDDDDDDDDE
jgi:hypothetical protein